MATVCFLVTVALAVTLGRMALTAWEYEANRTAELHRLSEANLHNEYLTQKDR
jgi:hypothetical protein